MLDETKKINIEVAPRKIDAPRRAPASLSRPARELIIPAIRAFIERLVRRPQAREIRGKYFAVCARS
jgi:hypothetical protein